MQLKKNPSIDAKRNSLLYFQIGLAAITALTYFGMEVKTPDPIIKVEKPEIVETFVEEEIIPLTMQVQKAPPPPPPAPEVIQVVDDKVVLEDKKIEPTDTNDKQEVNTNPVDYSNLNVGGDTQGTAIIDDVPFEILEDAPLFPACEGKPKAQQKQCFVDEMNKHVKKHFNYPEAALENNIQGRISCLITIGKDGVPRVKVKGPAGKELLEKEAQRIMDKLPKFKPGKQQGMPVGVSYTQPIVFKVNN